MKRLLFIFLLSVSQSVFGYDFKDICRDIAPTTETANAILSALHSFEKIQVDNQAKGFIKFIVAGKDSDSFYLGDLYRSDYFKPIENNYRAFTLKHVRSPETDRITVITEPYDDVDISQSNHYIAIKEIGIRENSIALLRKYRSYSFYYRSKESWANAGGLKPADIAGGILKILEPSNIEQMKVQPCERFDNLKNETRVLAGDFCRTFPDSSRLIDHYVEFNNFIEIENNTENTATYTHVKFQPKVKNRIIKGDYPDLAAYIDKYRKLITLNVALKSKNGNTYVTLIITPKKTLLEGYTYQGMVIPIDENGNLVFEEAGTFEKQKEIIGDVKLKIDFLGLDLKADCKGIIENQSTLKKEAYSAKVENIKYDYTGRLLGIIPISIIKFLSPVDIDKFVDDMIYVMLRGNNGEGSVVSIEWEEDELRKRYSKVYVSSEMLDHHMIEFITSVMRKFLGSKHLDKAMAQSQILGETVLSAVISDAKTVFSDLEYSSSFQEKPSSK